MTIRKIRPLPTAKRANNWNISLICLVNKKTNLVNSYFWSILNMILSKMFSNFDTTRDKIIHLTGDLLVKYFNKFLNLINFYRHHFHIFGNRKIKNKTKGIQFLYLFLVLLLSHFKAVWEKGLQQFSYESRPNLHPPYKVKFIRLLLCVTELTNDFLGTEAQITKIKRAQKMLIRQFGTTTTFKTAASLSQDLELSTEYSQQQCHLRAN